MNCIAFEGVKRIASGELLEVALAAKAVLNEQSPLLPVLILDAVSSEVVEVDFRGTAADVASRLAAPPRGPGRPKLGVVAREVTLLPRHWDWLNSQPGGASVALRKLVEEARRGDDGIRRSQEAAYRFMRTMAGNEPGFEEATRALFARNRDRFEQHIASWPPDVRTHALVLADPAMSRTDPVRRE